MSKTRIFLFLAGLVLLQCLPLAALDEQKTGFDIRFYDKSIYYVNRNDVFIKLTLTNSSSDTFRFRIADIKSYSIDFEAKTSSNTFLSHSQKYTIDKRLNQPIMYREVSLSPGEEYGFTLELGEFIDLSRAGLYTVQALFYPELITATNAAPLRSNRLTLNLRPPVAAKEMEAAIEVESGKPLNRQPSPPDEVVVYMLNARQRSQWEKFFLYLDMESLFRRSPTRNARFLKMSQEERGRALDEFASELRQEKVEQEILLIPRTFEILETSYGPSEAKVKVLEKFAYRDYIEKKRYTYSLDKRDRNWVIVDYSIENLGTE